MSDPLRHARGPIPLIPVSEPGFRSLSVPRKASIPPLPTFLNSLLDESTAVPTFPLSFANGEPSYDIPDIKHPHLHQAEEATPDVLSPPPSTLPRFSAPLTAQHPQNLPESTNVAFGAMSTFDQTQAQAAIHPPSTSTTFHGGGAAALPAPLVPLATTSPAPEPSNTVHICQCVTGGSPCNIAVSGRAPAVRDHLNRVHGFSSKGKDQVVCLWRGCGRTLQRENIPRHIVTCHFRVRVGCVECGRPLSRRDVWYSHARVCPARRQTASRLDSGM